MKEIEDKINELFNISEKFKADGWKSYLIKTEEHDRVIDELRKLAKANNTLLGRIIKFPKGDGYAMYVITKVNKKTVRIDWIDYGDGWIDDRCGKAALIDIDYASSKVIGEDKLMELFG
jgi:hypothetical protein